MAITPTAAAAELIIRTAAAATVIVGPVVSAVLSRMMVQVVSR